VKRKKTINISVAAGISHTKVGVFKNGSLVKFFKYDSRPQISTKKLFDIFKLNYDFQKDVAAGAEVTLSIASDAFEIADAYERLSQKNGVDFLKISSSLKLPLKINYDPPQSLGVERICTAVAAFRKYGMEAANLVVIDFGARTSFGLISDGAFRGGLISPGFQPYANALNIDSSYMFRIHYNRISGYLCRDDKSEIAAGVYGGYSILINGLYKKLIDDARLNEKEICVITTGGYSSFFTTNVDFSVINDQTLVLDGINIITKDNCLENE